MRFQLVVFGEFRLDLVDGALWRRQERLSLRPKSLAVLEHLVRNVGRLVTKDELLDVVWADTHVGEAVLKACVAEIRHLLDDRAAEPQFIETAPRRGYRFIGAVGVGNLPRPRTSFIGREHEVRAVAHQLSMSRLVTLHGPPGTGKSRLAMRVARELLPEQMHGAWWIDVAAVSEPGRILPMVTGVTGIRDQPGQPPLEALVDALHERRLLLVFDNCEHLVDECAALADALLGDCPHVTVLATSREPLRVPGEVVHYVPPLSMPDEAAPAREILSSEAVRMFIDRAQAASPSFAPSEEDAGTLATICRRIDGLPLGIELAAARVRALGAREIARRLEENPALPGPGSRTDPARHRTLTAALEWSFELLSSKERLLLPRLAVFAGSFTLAAVEAVCAGDGIEASEMLELTAQLVDHSLVVAATDPQDEETRYRFLHTIRLYARGKLAPELRERLARRHAEFFLQVATANGPALHRPGGDRNFALLTRESDNLHTAFNWAQRHRDADHLGLRIAAALRIYFPRAGQNHVGRFWLEESLRHSAGCDPLVRARALHGLGLIVRSQGNLVPARGLLEESAAIMRAADETVELGSVLCGLGRTMMDLGDLPEAERLVEEALSLLRRNGEPWELAVAMRDLGVVARRQGRRNDAVSLFKESAAILEGIPDPWLAVLPIGQLAQIDMDDRRFDEADGHWRHCLALVESLNDNYMFAYVVEGMAQVACGRGENERAARLFGITDRLQEVVARDAWFETSDQLIARLRETLGEEAFRTAWTAGRNMSRAEVVAEAQGTAAAAR